MYILAFANFSNAFINFLEEDKFLIDAPKSVEPSSIDQNSVASSTKCRKKKKKRTIRHPNKFSPPPLLSPWKIFLLSIEREKNPLLERIKRKVFQLILLNTININISLKKKKKQIFIISRSQNLVNNTRFVTKGEISIHLA